VSDLILNFQWYSPKPRWTLFWVWLHNGSATT